MNNNPVTNELPKCELLTILSEKINKKRNVDFDFSSRLNDFFNMISKEVRHINELFPEYTPHDKDYHLKRLFHVADTLLGKERFEYMNVAELFILAVSLLGHDWGMAVSNPEKQYISTHKIPNGTKKEDFCLLKDEHKQFKIFLKEKNISLKDYDTKKIPNDLWSDYVRQTHAVRSGERVRRFFYKYDGGVADATSRVCLGHFISFEELQDYRTFPCDFSVLRETVNLRAIALYLRLIDLFDLAEDRTPYVIWKFVAPHDPHSRMEWSKHRSLRPVTCPPYQEGRIIQVDGSTDDHEVFSALEDLRIFCENQLRGCNDLMARMKDPRHKLDLYHIDWRVAPRGFEPVSIQFEFDRDRMFGILGDEIYQGDPYVFLRELLQNSIDAIRMRREIIRGEGYEPSNLGLIQVDVTHGENGDCEVIWKDDGVGMDEYIIKNFLAIAGKSYYNSPEFERQGLKMDPISKFGIGILSCFMVSDHVEIVTFKDPLISPPSDPIKIIIPSQNRQFRIEKLPRETIKCGTTIKILVDGNKLPKNKDKKKVEPLEITSYLSHIAGFVEFPIVINESNNKTIIIHPSKEQKSVIESLKEKYEGSINEFQVIKLGLDFPWSDIFFPQDLNFAKKYFKVEHLDISSDLGLNNYEGFINYVVPSKDVIDLKRTYPENTSIIIHDANRFTRKNVRWFEKWSRHYSSSNDKVGIKNCRSSLHSPTFAVYRDGILISSALPPLLEYQSYSNVLPAESIIVNLPKLKTQNLDLSRTQIRDSAGHWSSKIYNAHFEFLYNKYFKDILKLDSNKLWLQMARLISFYRINIKDLWHKFPQDNWPFLLLGKNGKIIVSEWKDLKNKTIYKCPNFLRGELSKKLYAELIDKQKYIGPLNNWIGDRCLISVIEPITASFDSYRQIVDFPIEKFYTLDSVRFLQPPWLKGPPIVQKVFLPIKPTNKKLNIETLLEKTLQYPEKLKSHERKTSIGSDRHYFIYGGLELPEVASFPKIFDKFISYGWSILNIKHPIVKTLLQFDASIRLAKIKKTLSAEKIGNMEDIVKRFSYNSISYSPDEFKNNFQAILSLVKKEKLFDIDKETEELINAPLKSLKFIPDTLFKPGEKHNLSRHEDLDSLLEKVKNNLPFGTEIKDLDNISM